MIKSPILKDLRAETTGVRFMCTPVVSAFFIGSDRNLLERNPKSFALTLRPVHSLIVRYDWTWFLFDCAR